MIIKKPLLALLAIFFIIQALSAQDTIPRMYWLELTDKDQTPYSIWEPEEFLSPRAIERRNRQRISITEQDLPVDPVYIKGVVAAGAKIHNRSKWLNALTVVADSLTILEVARLPYVRSIEYVGKYFPPVENQKSAPSNRLPDLNYQRQADYYGHGSQQIAVLKGDVLHQLGHQGEGMMVAVLDGGFTNVDEMPFYDSLRSQHLLYGGYDFVDKDEYVFESSSHGSQVLSVMGSNLPGLFVGTAPAATYICLKTEDVRAEYLTEECNWVAAAEFADSIGADIINSSLGYTGFTDKNMNYRKDQLNGRHSRASRAGDIAFSKGMIVVNSAGNSGNDSWQTIGAPADGFDIFSIGAVRRDGGKASFSSFGPTADGRVKPDVSAIGQAISVASIFSYDVRLSNGTSFASPTIAGMIAALWSAFPDQSNEEVLEAVRQSSSQADNPDNGLGYGIPDFSRAYDLLDGSLSSTRQGRFHVFDDQLIVRSGIEGEIELIFSDLYGRKLLEEKISKADHERISIPFSGKLPGIFLLEIKAEGKEWKLMVRRKAKAQPLRP